MLRGSGAADWAWAMGAGTVFASTNFARMIGAEDDLGKGDPEAGEFRQNDVWYLLPVRAIAGVKSLRLFPDLKSRRPRWERYREAWEWMRRKR
jgi:hypothetical protein